MSTPQPILRKDYRPPAFVVDDVRLELELGERTTVHAVLAMRRNPAADPRDAGRPLALDGQRLELLEVRLDGRALGAGEYELDEERLVVPAVPRHGTPFRLETRVAIRPGENTELSGLYRSGGIFCTQCEAEGFRRITFFPDRPDVMASYEVRIVADEASCPVLLSNGNRVGAGRLDGGRHWVQWRDPFKKPCYLFALVAGQLTRHAGTFRTRSGRDVALEIWVEPRNADKCEHALRSLQKAMAWDERVFGLEYDLDLYMIVAVSDFNMGAMENKGLNVFNSKYVLARPDTATDDDYEHIEGVIAHEYFHNWTGNRVTCRDWFQLTLKEGLTVFRDQEFSMDCTSRAVKRIDDVKALRQVQFAEDSGPLSHPIRPESYVEMNNFYTATVYEKGAEVVRMYQTLLGRDGFRRGMDLYFQRHDGTAVTCDDFRAAMADANGVDLERFGRWYAEAGTPIVEAQGEWDAATRTYALTLRQSLPDVPGAPAGTRTEPLHVPVAVGLLGPDGRDLPLSLEGGGRIDGTTAVLELTERARTFRFRDVPAAPVPSLLRGFSAPVRLRTERGRHELAFLMAHDSDPFNRWDAGEELAKLALLDLTRDAAAGRPLSLDPAYLAAVERLLADPELDGSMKALALTLPAEKTLGLEMDVVDVDAIHAAREFARAEIGRVLRDRFRALCAPVSPGASRGPYSFERAAVDSRRLRNLALRYLVAADAAPGGTREGVELAARQLDSADNMTDAQAALFCLNDVDGPERTHGLAAFHAKWLHDPLVLDKWFSVQALSTLPGTLGSVRALARHPDFKLENPNRVRSLVHAFCAGNQVRFHDASGGGYSFLAEKVLELDPINPQVASRLATCLNTWRRFDPDRRERMRAQLERIAKSPRLSKDVAEIVNRSLA